MKRNNRTHRSLLEGCIQAWGSQCAEREEDGERTGGLTWLRHTQMRGFTHECKGLTELYMDDVTMHAEIIITENKQVN